MDGEWNYGCADEAVPASTWELIRQHGEMADLSPIALGHARWMPRPWLDAMREIRQAFAAARKG